MNNKKNEQLYLIAFSIYLIKEFLSNTMFKYSLPPVLFECLKWSALFLVIIKICFEKYDKSKILIIATAFILVIFASYTSTYKSLFMLLIFVIGAKNVSFKKIAKTYFFIVLPLLFFTIISSKLGIIEDLVYIRGNLKKHSFGVAYSTDFAAYVFYLMASYIYIKDNRISKLEYLLFSLIIVFVYKFCYARLDVGCMIILFLISILLRKNKINFKAKFVKIILLFSFTLCSLFMFLITYNYDWNNSIHRKIDEIFSGRLTIGKQAMNKYNIKLFGQKIDDHGFGGNTVFKYGQTDYIDCSYLRILLKYGLIVYIILIGISTSCNYKLYQSSNYLLLLLIFVISVNSMIAHHYMDFSYNVTLFAFLATIDDKRKDDVYATI